MRKEIAKKLFGYQHYRMKIHKIWKNDSRLSYSLLKSRKSLCVLKKISKTSLENLKITTQNCSLQKLLTMKLMKQACQQLGIENKRRKRLSQFNNNAIKSVTFVAVITVLTLYCCYLSLQKQSIMYAIPYSHMCERNKNKNMELLKS